MVIDICSRIVVGVYAFVPGGQTLIYTVARNEAERSLVVNSLGGSGS